MTVPEIKLHDGTSIPQLGFGVFQVPPEETAATVAHAFEAGYRHIDTAQMYENEAGVGAAIKDSGLARDELYITTKLNNGFHRPDDARRAIDESLERLGLEQTDLFLIHWPLPTQYDGDFVSTWKALIEAQKAGKTRSIGVSNFQPAHLDRIVEETGVVPVVNQVEVHPFFANEDVRAANAAPRRAHRGVVPDRAGQGQRRRHDRRDRRARRPYAGPGRPALARPARRHHLPQVDEGRADARELRDLRLRAHAPSRSARSTGSTGARPGGWARTRTRSTTSPADRSLRRRRGRCASHVPRRWNVAPPPLPGVSLRRRAPAPTA